MIHVGGRNNNNNSSAASAAAVSTGDNNSSDPMKYNNFLTLSKLNGNDRYSRNSSSNASTCLSGASQQLPVFSDQGKEEELSLIKLVPISTSSNSHRRLRTETFIEAKVRMRTSEPGQRLKQMFLDKHKYQNKRVQEVLDNSELVRRKSIATIHRAD